MSEEKIVMEEKKGLSRRKFLVGAMAAGGAVAAGLTRVAPALAADGVTLKINGTNVTTDVAPFLKDGRTMVPARFVAENLSADVAWDAASKTASVTSKEMTFPYPKKIDPEKARKAGYEGYYKANCGLGGAYGILSVMREEVGYPYTNIPYDGFRYGGGGAGKTSYCGALNGCMSIVGMILGKDITNADNNTLAKLNAYYTGTELPLNDKHTAWSIIKVSEPFTATSCDCKDSRNAWCTKFGYTAGKDEQKERCAKLVGDVCAKAIELLNAYYGK